MNLKDFKEWLNQFPDDTIVEVSVEQGRYGQYSSFEAFDSDDHSHYFDYIGSLIVKPDSSFYNKRFLQLGYN